MTLIKEDGRMKLLDIKKIKISGNIIKVFNKDGTLTDGVLNWLGSRKHIYFRGKKVSIELELLEGEGKDK